MKQRVSKAKYGSAIGTLLAFLYQFPAAQETISREVVESGSSYEAPNAVPIDCAPLSPLSFTHFLTARSKSGHR
jgi:hypothetical protein